jgi:hypothetical protein
MRLGTLCLLLAMAAAKAGDCETLRSNGSVRGTSESHLLKDIALYLTGSDADAAAVFAAYRKRLDPVDPSLPYPLSGEAPPSDLRSFLKSVQFVRTSSRWRKRTVQSRVKAAKRVIYRLVTTGDELGISIAETENRETEIAVEIEKNGNWNYFVYDEKGKLAGQSLFASVAGKNILAPAPLTCLTCHYDRSKRLFVQLPVAFNELTD